LISRKLEKFAQSLVGSSQEHALRATEVVRAVTAVHAATGQSNVGTEAAASSAARLAEIMASLESHVSRLHPVAPEDKSVMALKAEGAGERPGGEAETEQAGDRRRGGERRYRRSGGLRPVS
jgi:hypothetical protein